MDIFEQMESAHLMLVNGVLTTNFGWNPDDEEEDWCFSIYGVDPESRNNYEYYFDKSDLRNAERRDDVWMVQNNHDDDGFTKLEFCALVNVEDLPM